MRRSNWLGCMPGIHPGGTWIVRGRTGLRKELPPDELGQGEPGLRGSGPEQSVLFMAEPEVQFRVTRHLDTLYYKG